MIEKKKEKKRLKINYLIEVLIDKQTNTIIQDYQSSNPSIQITNLAKFFILA